MYGEGDLIGLFTHPFPPLGYIVLVFCYVSEVANHVKEELSDSWYTEVDTLSLFLVLLLLPSVIFVLTQYGSVKAQHGVLSRTHHLSRRNSQCYSQDLRSFALLCLGSNAQCCVCCGYFVSIGMFTDIYRIHRFTKCRHCPIV